MNTSPRSYHAPLRAISTRDIHIQRVETISTQRHAVEAGAAATSDALAFERACHRVRVSCDDR
jgi:hypothetical protein